MNTVINAQFIAGKLANSQDNKILLRGEDGISWTVSEMERYKLHNLCLKFAHTREVNYRQFNSTQDRDKFVELALKKLNNKDLIVCDFSTLFKSVTINATINSSGAGHFITADEILASNVLALTFLDKSFEHKENWWTISNTVMTENIEHFFLQLEQGGATVNKHIVEKFDPVQIRLEDDHVFVQCNPVKEPMHCALFYKHACFCREFSMVLSTSRADFRPENLKSTQFNWDGKIRVPFEKVKKFLGDLSKLSIPFICEQGLNHQQLIHKMEKFSSNCDKIS